MAKNSKKYFYGLGRRKESTVTVRLYEGKGESEFNGKKVSEVMTSSVERTLLEYPLQIADVKGDFHYTIKAKGGGKSGQRDAASLGLARALVAFDEELRKPLHDAGLLTRDSRIVERKKVNRRKARKSPQFSKR